MAEYFQSRKSDIPTYHVPSEFPKYMYGGNPHSSDVELKAAIENKLIRTKLVNTQEEQDRLLAKGWVLTPAELLEEQADIEVRALEDEPEFEQVIMRRRKKVEGAPPAAASDEPEFVGANKTPSPRLQRQTK
jgi:hypothetical protein